MYQVIITAIVSNPAVKPTGMESVGEVVLYTAPTRLDAEHVCERLDTMMQFRYQHVKNALLALYPDALVGSSVRPLVQV